MSFRSEKHGKYILRPAVYSDNDDIREIFESGSFAGGLNVQFLRGPEPLASFAADGDRAYIIAAEDTEKGKVIAIGGAVVQTLFLDGTPAECAYLTGLKVHHHYRGKLAFIPRAYGIIGKTVSGCAATYTTILDGNQGVIRMLEKRRKNMPEYRYIGHYTTFCLGRGKSVIPVETDNTTGFDRIVARYFSGKALAPCSTEYKGFGSKRFYCLRDSSGDIEACCFIGDQSASKYYRMCSYGGIYRAVSHLPTALFGYPAFPVSGEIIKNGIISFLYVRDNDHKLCSAFLRSAAYESGFPMLLWGGEENDPLCCAVGKMRTVRYGSRLYEVLWDGAADTHINGVVGMEAALL